MFGPYAAYVIPAYAISALVIAGLVAWTRIQYRQRLRELASLEERGIRRRAERAAERKRGGKR